MSGVHVPDEVIRDVVATVESLHKRTHLSRVWLLSLVGIRPNRYHRWRGSLQVTAQPEQPRQCSWEILPEEHEAILAYHDAVVRDGRRVSHRVLTYEMIDNDIAACSTSTTYRVLKTSGRIPSRQPTETQKGTGFVQPITLHDHWHIDISYLWEFGYRAYLISVLEGKSRYVLHHRVMKSMTTGDVELVLQRAREMYPEARPSLVSDNGSQFLSNQFKGFIADCGYEHRRTSVSYPQSNGKMERQFRTTKEELRLRSIIDHDDLTVQITDVIDYYNKKRLHSALGYVTPADVLQGRADLIMHQRRAKLDEARARRKQVNSQLFN